MTQFARRAAPRRFNAAPYAALVTVLGLALLVAGPASAQITRGGIVGVVRDATGAVVPGAGVTATNVATNIGRSTVTDEQGLYRIAALDPGRYTVRTELAGFSTVEVTGVTVRTATDTTLNVELKVAPVESETITVTGQSGSIELNKSNPTVGLTTTARQAVELPLPAGRNINNLVLLTPNAVNATGVGQGSYVINGQRSRNNNYMIDGSDNNDISVTIATSQIVPETVAEFQVLTNPYSVEFGRNSGGQINVITKSGTNRFRGEVWDYYTTHKLFSLNNLEKDQGRDEPAKFDRHQVGASIGGPLVKDKTFFFALFQLDTQRPGPRPGATVRIPTPAGWAALQSVPLRAGQSAASRQAVLDRIRFLEQIYATNPAFRNLTNTLVNGVPIQTGQVNVDIVDPSDYKTPFVRLDHRLGDSDHLTLRYSFNDRVDENAISNCNLGEQFCGSQDLKDTNVALSETHIFRSTLLNEFRASWVRRDLQFPENDPESPTAAITGLFTVGGLSNFPQGRLTDTFQFSDTLTWTRDKHTFKFGADVRYNKVDNSAAFDSKGTFTFNNLQDYMNNQAAVFQQALQTASFQTSQWQTFFFVSDDFRVTPDLTLNLGLRYELSTVPLGFFGATDAQSLGAMVPPPVKKDTNNWAPRVGFAWSPRSGNSLLGDGKTVFRGGFGVGYDVLFYNLLTVNASNFPRVVVPRLTDVLDVYPNRAPLSGTAVFNPLATFVNSNENTENPMARYWSFSVQREVSNFVVELGYTASRSYHGINQIDMNPAILTPEQAQRVRETRSSTSIPSTQARRLFPQFGSRVTIPSDTGPNGVDTEARGQYDAGFVSINRRFSGGLQFGLSYTLSRFMSNNDASLGEQGTDAASQRPQDYFNYAAEWSRSVFDRPHRLVANWIWEIPGPKEGLLGHILGGWQISGVTQGQSGRPFTILSGVDSSGDGNTGSDRPNIDPNGTFTWDKERKNFTNNGYYVVPLGTNNLPLANSLGPGNAPRNSERGAPWWNTDLSVLKRFRFGDRQFHLRGDILNAFDQDNLGIPINNMTNPGFGTNAGGPAGTGWGRRSVVLSAKFIW